MRRSWESPQQGDASCALHDEHWMAVTAWADTRRVRAEKQQVQSPASLDAHHDQVNASLGRDLQDPVIAAPSRTSVSTVLYTGVLWNQLAEVLQ